MGEQRARRLDGSEIDIEVTVAETTFDGQPAFQFVARDVSERKRADARMKLLVAAASEAPDGVQVVSLDGRVMYSNRAVEKIYGFSPGELRGRHVNEMNVEPDFADKVIIPSVRETGRWNGELMVKHKDGHAFPVWLTTSMVMDGDEPLAMVGIIRDMTERRQLEEARRRAEDQAKQESARFEAMVEMSPVGVFVVDAADGHVVFANQESERLIGHSPGEGDSLGRVATEITYRRPDGRLCAPEDLPLQRALLRGEVVRAEELIFERPDGSSTPTLVSATPVRAADGRITGGIAVIQDISPIEELERLRNDFLGMVSHEMRTPLTAIKGAVATALDPHSGFDVNEARELFRIVDEQTSRLRDLISNLTDISRIEAGALSISREVVDLRSACSEAVQTFERSGGRNEVELALPDDLPLVYADGNRLGQVLSNLLGNAGKFSPANEPIRLTADCTQSSVVVKVIDRGRGIPADKVAHLFRKFSQVHEDAGSGLQGSGLGLAICKGIVEAHGGRIWAESAGEGLGATFSFTLPIASEAQMRTARAPEREEVVEPPRTAVKNGRRPRVLVVDDEVQVLRYLRRTLEEAGYEPVLTGEASHVAELVESRNPDLVLLDLRMPRLDGFELLERLREFSQVPVIFLTASDRSEDVVRALRMGADDYILKPFSPSELLARIDSALRRRAPGQEHAEFHLGDLTIDFARRRVAIAGREIGLSPTEYKLLYELASHAGRVLTHDQILARVWGPEYQGATDLLRSFVVLLRRRLGDDARHPRYIFTEPRVGYRVPQP